MLKNKTIYKLLLKNEEQVSLKNLISFRFWKEYYLNKPKEVLIVDEHYRILRRTSFKDTYYTHLTHVNSKFALPKESIKAWVDDEWYVSKICTYDKENEE